MADSDGDDSVDDELLQALGSSDEEDGDGSGSEQEDDDIVFTSSSAREASPAGSAKAPPGRLALPKNATARLWSVQHCLKIVGS